jgi:hypothetical protein
MPETMFGLPQAMAEKLRQPVQSVPRPVDPAEKARQREAQIEAQLKERRALAEVWRVEEFRRYCNEQMRVNQDHLMKATEHSQMLAAQALARAWATVIRDLNGTSEYVRQLEEELVKLRTST